MPERVKERDAFVACACRMHACVPCVSAVRTRRTRRRPLLMAMVRRSTPGGGGAITGGSASRQVNRRTGFFFVRRAITIGSRSLSSVPIVFHRRRRLSRSVHLRCSGPTAASRRYTLRYQRSHRINQWPTILFPERRYDARDDATLLRNGITLK